jgi:hypothetical protein
MSTDPPWRAPLLDVDTYSPARCATAYAPCARATNRILISSSERARAHVRFLRWL